MSNYVHRPTPISAWQFTGPSSSLKDAEGSGIEIGYGSYNGQPFATVNTGSTTIRVTVGEWVVLDDSGIVYVYNNAYFNENYEVA